MSKLNENRPGYKKTKVGWIPEEWETRRIGQLCSFHSGHGFRKQDWSIEGLPIIRIQNLNYSREFNYFAGETNPEWLVYPGDLLFAWAGVKGVSFGPRIWHGPKGVLNQHIYKIRTNSEVDKSWFFLALLRITEIIEKKAHGFKSSLLTFTKGTLLNKKYPSPLLMNKKKSPKSFPPGTLPSSRSASSSMPKNASKKPSCSNCSPAKNGFRVLAHQL
jgi:type I restriction enzyme S subunit